MAIKLLIFKKLALKAFSVEIIHNYLSYEEKSFAIFTPLRGERSVTPIVNFIANIPYALSYKGMGVRVDDSNRSLADSDSYVVLTISLEQTYNLNSRRDLCFLGK